jgi:hypothetical protein
LTLEQKQLEDNQKTLGLGKDAEICFLEKGQNPEEIDFDSATPKYVFTICPIKGDIKKQIKVITEAIDSEDDEKSDGQSVKSDKQSLKEINEESSCVIVKNVDPNVDPKYIAETLLKLSKLQEKEGNDIEEYQISAYKVIPNNYREEPKYDKNSDDEVV